MADGAPLKTDEENFSKNLPDKNIGLKLLFDPVKSFQPLLGKLDLPANIILAWKGLDKHSSLSSPFVSYEEKNLKTLAARSMLSKKKEKDSRQSRVFRLIAKEEKKWLVIYKFLFTIQKTGIEVINLLKYFTKNIIL